MAFDHTTWLPFNQQHELMQAYQLDLSLFHQCPTREISNCRATQLNLLEISLLMQGCFSFLRPLHILYPPYDLGHDHEFQHSQLVKSLVRSMRISEPNDNIYSPHLLGDTSS